VRSPTRVLAASTLGFEALVVFFAGLVAKDLSSLSTGAALGLTGGLALACLVTAGLLRHRAGYAVGWVLQVAVVGLGFWVPVMFALGGVFGLLWFLALRLGRQAEADALARHAAAQQTPESPQAQPAQEGTAER
jgi:hypothetical protein